jgi:predicted DNA-binding transcriptional regulator AlpA
METFPNPHHKPTMTVVEAGEFLGLSRALAYKAANSGDLPTFRIGARIFVPTSQLLELVGLGDRSEHQS